MSWQMSFDFLIPCRPTLSQHCKTYGLTLNLTMNPTQAEAILLYMLNIFVVETNLGFVPHCPSLKLVLKCAV